MRTLTIAALTTLHADRTAHGVTLDDLLAAAGVAAPSAYVLAQSYDDYDTNVPVADLVGGRAMIATRFGGAKTSLISLKT